MSDPGALVGTITGEIVPTLTTSQARALTDRIKGAAEQLWSLLLEAHEGRAWAALGYPTWADYVRGEFDMSRSRSYQILDQGRVVRAISGAVSTNVDISEGQARDIKLHLAEVTEEISGRVAGGEEPTEVVTEVVTKTRRKARVANQAPDICEDDLERQRRASVLFRALEHLGQFAVSPEEAIADIPDEQAFRVDEYLDAAKWWLERFAAAWTEQQRRVGSS